MDFFGRQQSETKIAQFKKSLTSDRDYLKALNGIGISFTQRQKYGFAIAIFNNVIKQDRSFYHAYYYRGYVYQKQGKKSLALQDFNVVLEQTNYRHIPALINRYLIYCWLQKYDLAKQDLNRVIEVAPQETTAYYNRALINAVLGDRNACNRDLEIAEKLYKAADNTSGILKVRQLRRLLKF